MALALVGGDSLVNGATIVRVKDYHAASGSWGGKAIDEQLADEGARPADVYAYYPRARSSTPRTISATSVNQVDMLAQFVTRVDDRPAA